MRLGTTNLSICKARDGRYFTNIFTDSWKPCETEHQTAIAITLYRTFSNKKLAYADQCAVARKIAELESIDSLKKSFSEEIVSKKIDKEAVKQILDKLLNFFTEFSFTPGLRFVNTFAYSCNTSYTAAKQYVESYFELIDSQYTQDILEKMKSDEFKEIVNTLSTINPTHKINNRFKLYYGSQGTGKTTQAMKEADDCMVCHSAMLPSDLMEDFNFHDGKAEFKPSALCKVMTEGKVIVLDEINLLPFESLRFLQSILDGKTQFTYKGRIINIKEGFKIIGTMNLNVNGCTYSLPEPLVDRCESIRKYNLSAENLIGAII